MTLTLNVRIATVADSAQADYCESEPAESESAMAQSDGWQSIR